MELHLQHRLLANVEALAAVSDNLKTLQKDASNARTFHDLDSVTHDVQSALMSARRIVREAANG